MSFSLAEQTLVFLEAILLGSLAGVIYDICRAFRIEARLKTLGTVVTDILFWVFVIVFLFIFAITDAVSQMRFYIIVGEISGISLYFLTLSQIILPVFRLSVCLILFCVNIPIRIFKFLYSKIHIFKEIFKHCIEIIKKIKKRLSFFIKSG